MARIGLLLAVLALAALPLPGCGGGKEGDSAPTSASMTSTEEAAPGVPVSKQGDNSIQIYGAEASPAERSRLGAMVQRFLNARAAGEWAQVCSLLAAELRTEQSLLAGGASCAKAMAFYAKDASVAVLRREARITVLSLRVAGDHAFVIYRRPDGVFAIPFVREGGAWKVLNVGPSELS